ncbi:hypothetical protein J6590_048697 [Homalodisca vitripennis]|nr:hypothetical protein J6590_048697 [Homalodisca vitripennis]
MSESQESEDETPVCELQHDSPVQSYVSNDSHVIKTTMEKGRHRLDLACCLQFLLSSERYGTVLPFNISEFGTQANRTPHRAINKSSFILHPACRHHSVIVIGRLTLC